MKGLSGLSGLSGVVGGGGDAVAPTYAEILRDTYGADEVWPLLNIASGTTIPAKIDMARNGTLSGWDLQNAAGPVISGNAPYLDGANDTASILSTSLNSIFSGSIGNLFIWAKVPNATVWNDGTKNTLIYIKGVNSFNFIVLRKYEGTGANQGVIALTKWSNVDQNWFYATTTLSWFSLGFSWDKTAAAGAGEGKLFVNGIQRAGTKTFGTWGAGSLTKVALGCSEISPILDVFDGWIAYVACKFGSIWSPTDFLNMHNDAATAPPD